MEAFVGGLAVLGRAPDRPGALHAEGGQDAWLEVRPFVLALAISPLQGEGLRLGTVLVAPDTTGGRSKGHRAALQAQPRGRPDRTGREEPHRTTVIEASEATARGIVVPGLRGDGLPQKKRRVLL